MREALERRGPLTLHAIKQLIGEALVPESQRRSFFDICVGLEDAVLSNDAHDQIGRSGIGVARNEGERREELIFDVETLELLGTRQVLINAQSGYAPAFRRKAWRPLQLMPKSDGGGKVFSILAWRNS